MTASISIKVNGKAHLLDVDPQCPLLYVLRDTLALNNPRFGCGLGQCGACTVLIDNHAVRSCVYPVGSAVGKQIATLDGLGALESSHRIQQAFIDEQASQCGYCLNGWIMSTRALLHKNPNPTEDEIRGALAGLVCRCGSHVRMLRAVRRAAGRSD